MRPTSRRSSNETKAQRRASSAPAPAGEEPPKSEAPKSQNELRLSLVRKLAIVLDGWRACPERVCRRQRGCASPRLTCLQSEPARPLSPDKQAAMLARFQRDLRREMARRGLAQ